MSANQLERWRLFCAKRCGWSFIVAVAEGEIGKETDCWQRCPKCGGATDALPVTVRLKI